MEIKDVSKEQTIRVTLPERRYGIPGEGPRYRMELMRLGPGEEHTPTCCALCALHTHDLILTPWEHLCLCDRCLEQLGLFCRVLEGLGPDFAVPRTTDFD